ncbi:glycoprotein-N-acetylgalactosamine 3-beta-galactosyltransferase 1 isoform X2 [Aethina tumida]|uniref:glycoprotein-N-acetylgalactosamine 3-beta-galactosyltransferase 1 isoform X2 n=1 Tax=Aethina tumida TaxID=116153 RepID=UPI00096B484E|nr:glycoprotein-N-acetylgalactosamine 3-beta-galactosyltransferase 1 isoform X2 [Aethina tumida]
MFKTTRTRLRKTLLIVYRRLAYHKTFLVCIICGYYIGNYISSKIVPVLVRPKYQSRFSYLYHLSNIRNGEEYYSKSYNTTKAEELNHKIRVLCWVLTAPHSMQYRGMNVKNTWGKRCHKLVFMGSDQWAKNITEHFTPEVVPVVGLKTPEGRENLWGKSREALKYLYDNYLTEYDWFMKADDDTYVIMENLRYLLRDKDPTDAIYFGCKYKSFVKQGYMSGGAGYVMSREALKRFVEVGLEMKPVHCKKNEVLGNEDVEVGRCLEASGVKAGDSRDKQGRIRFFGLYMEEIMSMSAGSGWYSQYQFYYRQQGLESLSDYPVALHYVTPVQMYFLEYMLYHARAYGLYPVDDA